MNIKKCFGKLCLDIWLGNDNIAILTYQDVYNLRFDLEEFDGQKRFAVYSSFRIADESEDYKMTVDSYIAGDAKDSLIEYHNNKKFSTKDRHNGSNKNRHCAQLYQDGWRYGDCHESNPNGRYLRGEHKSYADGINWKSFRGYNYSLKKTNENSTSFI